MTQVEVKTVADIKAGMKFTIPPSGAFPEALWTVIRPLGLQDSVNIHGMPILNKRGNLFLCQNDEMDSPLRICFDQIEGTIGNHGFKFYDP